MKLKQRIEKMEPKEPDRRDLESWSVNFQNHLNMIYNGGKPFTLEPAEEFLESMEQACERVYGVRANYFDGKFSKPKKKKRARRSPEQLSDEKKEEMKNE